MDVSLLVPSQDIGISGLGLVDLLNINCWVLGTAHDTSDATVKIHKHSAYLHRDYHLVRKAEKEKRISVTVQRFLAWGN